MSAGRHARVSALFLEVLEQAPDRRAEWLAQTCPDPDVRREVEAMLAHQDAVGLLDAPLLDRSGPGPVPNRRIGPWRVTAPLGEGGMGTVYRAQRADDTFEQHAALKLVHPGVRHGFRSRFLHERALLAGLDHPGIARLLDGGMTDDGTPYLAMELVEGEPITAYAERHGLDVGDRLQLFLQACEAVAYAHRNLVVHRDLKPAHILVAGEGTVKLLDFGIAKLLDAPDDGLTQTSGGPMTPAYAAPEQILRQPITTATDVYALGVVLYELLTDQRPYRLADRTAAQIERIVCEADPASPSAVSVPDRARRLAGDLDAITLRAMAKAPERRYASAEALAEDLRRHLDGLPVQARPPTVGYRIGRFLRRHRAGVATAAALVALLATVVGLYTVRLGAERDRAQRAATEATRQAERAEAVAGFLEQILRAPNSRWYVDGEATGPDTPIRAVLDEAAVRVEAEFADLPDLQADLHHLLGDTYLALGLTDESGFHHRRVLALRESLYTPPHPKLAEALYYAYPFADTLATGVGWLRRAVAMQRARPEGNNFPFMAIDLAASYIRAERSADVQSLLRDVDAYVDTHFVAGRDNHRYRHPVQANLTNMMAALALDLGDDARAARWLAASDSVRTLLPREPDYSFLWFNHLCVQGRLWHRQGRLGEAERVLRACLGEPSQEVTSPFSGTRPAGWDYAGRAATALADLLGDTPEARPYRQIAARYRTQRDSVRALLAIAERQTNPDAPGGITRPTGR